MAVASATSSAAIKAPSSTFSSLLRQSRFASYDPCIAQTYSSPNPAHARRGNYGLKRPIPLPYKDSYISLPTFEHHAHFAEWNNAEAQVKFVKRVEEMGVHPRSMVGGAWEKGLGEARTQWVVDSEFATEEEYRYSGVQAAQPPPPQSLDEYGKQGPGGYGARRPPPKTTADTGLASEMIDGNHLQVNVDSLSPKQFQRYLSKLRELSPEFKAYLLQQHVSRIRAQMIASARDQNLPPPTEEEIQQKIEESEDELLLLVASRNAVQKLHRRFLSRHFGKTYDGEVPQGTNGPVKIEAQPHQNGALTYTHYSPLDSLLSTPPQPGLVLQYEPKSAKGFFYGTTADTAAQRRQEQEREQQLLRGEKEKGGTPYIALFGGLTAKLKSENAGVNVPLYDPENANDSSTSTSITTSDGSSSSVEAIPMKTTPEALERSTSTFRMKHILLRTAPRTVGFSATQKKPKQLLDEVSLDTECTTELPWSKRNLINPWRPGSYEYSAHVQVVVKNRMLSTPSGGKYSVGNILGGAGAGASGEGNGGGFSFARLKQKERENNAKRALKGAAGVDRAFGRSVAGTLGNIVRGGAGKGFTE